MSILHPPAAEARGSAHPVELRLRPNRLFTVVAMLAMVVGSGSVLGGIVGASYTYQQAAAEHITTPDDAILPEVPVRGPLSLYAQSDIITQHQLDATGGLRYADMAREAPVLDEDGDPVLDGDGQPVMGPNQARASWIDATALTTALNLGLLAYALSAFAVVVGLTLAALGAIVLRLRRDAVAF